MAWIHRDKIAEKIKSDSDKIQAGRVLSSANYNWLKCRGIVMSYHNEKCKKIPNKTWDICLSDITDTPHPSPSLYWWS